MARRSEFSNRGRFYVDTTRDIPELVYPHRILGSSGKSKLIDTTMMYTGNESDCHNPVSNCNVNRFGLYEYRKIVENNSKTFDTIDLRILRDFDGHSKLWQVDLYFDAFIPGVRDDMQPEMNRVYTGSLGEYGIVIKVGANKPLLVRKGEYAAITDMRMTDYAHDLLEEVKSTPQRYLQYAEESETARESIASILSIVRRAIRGRELRPKIVYDESDSTPAYLVNRKLNQEAPLYQRVETQEGKRAKWSSLVTFEVNLASPVVRHIMRIADVKHQEKVQWMLYLYFRAVLRSVGHAYFVDFPQEAELYHRLADKLEDEYNAII